MAVPAGQLIALYGSITELVQVFHLNPYSFHRQKTDKVAIGKDWTYEIANFCETKTR